MREKVYILFDGRACGGVGTDEAAVLVSCDSMQEAAGWCGEFGEMACYSYDVTTEQGHAEAVNEKWEWDYRDGDTA